MSRDLIAFDLDGTLEDSRDDMVSAIHRVRRRFGLGDRSDKNFRDHVNRGMGHLYAECFSELLAQGKLDDVRAAYTEDYGARIAEKTRLYDGMTETLLALKQQFSLAVVTNKPERLSNMLLDALGVLEHFDAVIGGDTASRPKPAAAPLEEAVRRANISGRVIMVGDSAGDIACARAYGCPVIWCEWGYAATFGAVDPDRVAKSPMQLPMLIEAILS
ncbi:MAG: HAD-IA family hydrolase [Myxococcota bacterium]|nr:HAD-IA family hydrolase [Myxococcota bacterium]